MPLPTAEDFGIGSMDVKSARDHFLGKTLEQAEILFRDGPYLYFEDLMWMGAPAFRFYFPAAVRALVTSVPEGDAYPLASFAGTLEHRLAFHAAELGPLASALASACRQILSAHTDTFINQAEVYGDLQGRYIALQDSFTKAMAQQADCTECRDDAPVSN